MDELEEILDFHCWSLDRTKDENRQGVKDLKQALTELIHREVSAAQADILIWATGGIKEFTEDGKIYIPKKIAELTAPKDIK